MSEPCIQPEYQKHRIHVYGDKLIAEMTREELIDALNESAWATHRAHYDHVMSLQERYTRYESWALAEQKAEMFSQCYAGQPQMEAFPCLCCECWHVERKSVLDEFRGA